QDMQIPNPATHKSPTLAARCNPQVQQEPSVETREGTGINVTCSHPSIQANYIHWYRQLPGRAHAFLVSAVTGSKEVPDPMGRLSVSADRRSSALWLARPRLGDAAVYYCAVDPREAKLGLRPGTNRIGRGGGTVPSCARRGRCSTSVCSVWRVSWSVQRALCSVWRVLYPVRRALCSVWRVLSSVQRALCSV
uniref:Ig-like domain-containing protein n=1 Tax=Coturnix japonica TaxID=93934 RepID=A0A8C2U8C6_COTJA